MRSARRHLLVHLLHANQPVAVAPVRERQCRRFAECRGRLGRRSDASFPLPQDHQLYVDHRKQTADDVIDMESLVSDLYVGVSEGCGMLYGEKTYAENTRNFARGESRWRDSYDIIATEI